MLTYFLLGTPCGGRRCALPPCTPPPAFIFLLGSPYYLLSLPFSQNIVSLSSSVAISTETCAYVLLAWYASAPSPLHPPTRFFFFRPLPLLHTLTPASVLRGEALRPDPPTRFFFCQLPLLPTLISLPFLQNMVSLGSSVTISTETCAYVLLAGYALRGEGLHPPPAFIFCSAPLATSSHSIFSVPLLFIDIHPDYHEHDHEHDHEHYHEHYYYNYNNYYYYYQGLYPSLAY